MNGIYQLSESIFTDFLYYIIYRYLPEAICPRVAYTTQVPWADQLLTRWPSNVSLVIVADEFYIYSKCPHRDAHCGGTFKNINKKIYSGCFGLALGPLARGT